jgi:hypothetical protein
MLSVGGVGGASGNKRACDVQHSTCEQRAIGHSAGKFVLRSSIAGRHASVAAQCCAAVIAIVRYSRVVAAECCQQVCSAATVAAVEQVASIRHPWEHQCTHLASNSLHVAMLTRATHSTPMAVIAATSAAVSTCKYIGRSRKDGSCKRLHEAGLRAGPCVISIHTAQQPARGAATGRLTCHFLSASEFLKRTSASTSRFTCPGK